MKKTLFFAFFVCVGIVILNLIVLQMPMQKVITDDSRNSGIHVFVHYKSFVNPTSLVFDLRSIDEEKSMADVFRVLLQYAESVQNKEFTTVTMEFKGTPKFIMDGAYFKTLGEEYSWQNSVYTMRTFPENLLKIDGTPAFQTWSGGILGVLNKQMQDFSEVFSLWFLDDPRFK